MRRRGECLQLMLMLSPRRYSCDELRHTGAARYAAGRELPGGDVILPAGLASVVAAVADSLDTELVTVNTGTRVTNIDWWVVCLVCVWLRFAEVTMDSSLAAGPRLW